MINQLFIEWTVVILSALMFVAYLLYKMKKE